MPYATATAFTAAVTDRLRQAAVTSPHALGDLQRQFAYQRLLARVFADLASPWVLKGGTGLLVRFPDARHSIDVDLFRAGGSLESAVADLRALSGRDLGDFFRFEVGPPYRSVLAGKGARVSVAAYIGARRFAEFKADIVSGLHVTGDPELVRPVPLVDLPGLTPPLCRVYPLADHIADKVCGIVERHGPEQRPSTRYRDLVDLVLIAQRAAPAADGINTALCSEFERRGLAPLTTLDVPDSGWDSGYAAEARRAGLTGELARVAGALRLVRALVDPVLAGNARGVWSPSAQAWDLG